MTTPAPINVTGWFKQSFDPVLRGDYTAIQAAYTPVFKADFEGGVVGAPIADNFTNAFGTVYSNTEANVGSQSAVMSIRTAVTGFGTWGIAYDHATPLLKGTTLWSRWDTFFPAGFNFDTNVSLKFIRYHVVDSANGNRGYVDLYINEDGTLRFQNELGLTEEIPNSPIVQFDVWEQYQVAVFFHESEGWIRVWKGSTLIYERFNDTTMLAVDDESPRIYLMTYWNGGAPLEISGVTGTPTTSDTVTGATSGASFAIDTIEGNNIFRGDGGDNDLGFQAGETLNFAPSGASATLVWESQSCYVDNVIVTTNKPIGVDAAGNTYIQPSEVA